MIRKARPEEAETLARVHRASVQMLCRDDYSDDEVDEWVAPLTAAFYRHLVETKAVIVFEVGGRIDGLGVYDVGAGLVHAIYVEPSVVRSGVGRALLRAMEADFAAAGTPIIRLNATLNAIGFYAAMGFARGENAKNHLPSGAALAAVQMTKRRA